MAGLGGVVGNVEAERRLAHAGAAGDNVEFAGKKRAYPLVKIGYAGFDARRLPCPPPVRSRATRSRNPQ